MCIRCAISEGDTGSVHRTLTAGNGFDVNASYDGRTALDFAVMHGRVACVRLLMRYGANPDIKGKDGSTALHHAVIVYNVIRQDEVAKDLVFILLRGNFQADPNLRNSHGYTPLHLAASGGRVDLAKLLLGLCGYPVSYHKINPNPQDQNGQTPLHLACFEGNVEMAKLLLQHGANIGIRDNDGSTALDVACFIGNSPQLVRLLLDGGGNANHRHFRSGASLLKQAVGASEVVKVLLEFGVNPNVADPRNGKVALDLACEHGSLSSIFLLFKRMVGDGSIKSRREIKKRKRMYQIRWDTSTRKKRPERKTTQTLINPAKPPAV